MENFRGDRLIWERVASQPRALDESERLSTGAFDSLWLNLGRCSRVASDVSRSLIKPARSHREPNPRRKDQNGYFIPANRSFPIWFSHFDQAFSC